MKKKLVRLTESDLHRIVENSVRRIISERKKDYSKPGKRFGKLDGEDVQECGLDKNGNPCYVGNNPSKGRKTKKGYKFSSYGDFKPNEVKESFNRENVNEDFEQDYNDAKNNYNRQLWGMEMKNPEGEWEYGDVTYDPKTQTMSCMNATIEVDPDFSVDENLQALYDELINQGYNDGDYDK